MSGSIESPPSAYPELPKEQFIVRSELQFDIRVNQLMHARSAVNRQQTIVFGVP
jgi:hypothetical protein